MKKEIGNFGKLDEIGYFAVGNNELENQPEVGKTAICPHCKKRHKVEYGEDVKTKKISKTIGFVKCKNKETYLVSINRKLL